MIGLAKAAQVCRGGDRQGQLDVLRYGRVLQGAPAGRRARRRARRSTACTT